MSIITPAGKNKLDWSPKYTLVKTASEGQEVQEVQEEKDDLLDAAKSVIDGGTEETSSVDVEKAVAEVVQRAEKAEAVAEKAEVAVEKIQEAAQELKDVCGDKEVEVEVEVKDDGEVKEIGEVEECEEGGEDIIIESEPDVQAEGRAMAKDKKKAVKSSVEEEFCRFAKLSDANRKKLTDYWANMLGYPKDVVALLTKDYEK